MTAEQAYISYLETKVCDQDFRIKELESVLMLICLNEGVPVNREFMYLKASTALWKAYPFSVELTNEYKKLLNEPGAKI